MKNKIYSELTAKYCRNDL